MPLVVRDISNTSEGIPALKDWVPVTYHRRDALQLMPPRTYAAYAEGGDIVAVGGVVVTEGRGHCWVACGPLAQKYGVALVYAFRRVLTSLVKGRSLHRLEAMIHEDDPQSAKLLEAFGLTYEGRLKDYYADGTAVLMYGRGCL